MDRRLIAYLLIGLMALAIAALVAFKLYYSRDRIAARRHRKVREEREERMAGRDE